MEPAAEPSRPAFPSGEGGGRGIAKHLLLALLACLACGVIIHQIFDLLALADLPSRQYYLGRHARPGGLRLFLSLFLPAAFGLPSLALGFLCLLAPAGEEPRRLREEALRQDAVSYLLLPAAPVLVLLGERLGDWQLALGLLFWLATLGKGTLLWRLGWRLFWARPPRGGLRPLVRLATVAALCCPLFLAAAWTEQNLSAAGDETGYLLLTHSLARHGSSDPAASLAGGEQAAFYWGRWSPELAKSGEEIQSLLYPLLAAPAYAFLGRLGVLWLNALALVLAGLGLFAWLTRAGIGREPAATAVGLCLLAAPVLLLSQMAYPDTLGLLALVGGLLWLDGLARRPRLTMAGLLALAVALQLLKERLLPLGLGLILAGALGLAARRFGARRVALWLGGLLLAAGLLVWLAPAGLWPASLQQHLHVLHKQFLGQYGPLTAARVFLGGIFLDQTFGVPFAAPIYLLALAGLPAGLRRHPRQGFNLLCPVLLYGGLLLMLRWFQWYGGFTSAGRLVAVCLPPAALFLATSLEALAGAVSRLVWLLPAVLTLAYSSVLCLLPQLRFGRVVGVNPLLGGLGDLMDLPLAHLFPSTLAYSPVTKYWLAGGLLALGGLAAFVWRRLGPAGSPAPPPAAPPGPASHFALALGLLLLAGVLLAGARLWPPRTLEAEAMARREGSLYAEYAFPGRLRGVSLRDGGELRGRLFFPGGAAVLDLLAYNERPGRVELWVDETRRAEFAFQHQGRPIPVELGPVARGRHEVRLVWRSCQARACFLLVDRLRLLP